jgi:MFS family permease
MTQTGSSRRVDPAGVWVTLRESSLPVRAMLVGVLVNRLGAFLQTFLVLFLTHRGFTEVQAGFALGTYGGGAFLGVIIGGALADRLGPRYATLVSMCGTAGLLVVVLYVRSFPAVIVSVAFAGLVNQFYRPAAATLLSELTPKHQQVMIYAVYRLAINLGTTAAPVAGAVLITVSYDLLFWAQAVAALIYAGIAGLTLPKRPAHGKAADVDARGRRGYVALLADGRYLLYLLAILVNSLVYIQYVATLPLTMQDLGFATIWYAVLVSLNGFIVITCELFVTKFVQRLPLRVIIVTGFSLLGGGLAMYALPFGLWIFVVGTLVWTLAEIIGGPTMMSYAGLVAPPGLRGRYIGAMQTMFSLGAAIGPAVGVAVYQWIGLNAWWVFGLACAAAIVFGLGGMRRPEPEPAESAR